MNCAANFVVFKVLHLEGFKNYSLARHCSVSVNNDRDHFSTFIVAASQEVLFGTSAAHYNWIHALEMRWIGQESYSHFDLVTGLRRLGSSQRCSQVVLNIARSCVFCGVLLVGSNTLELSHDDLQRLSDHICQDIESTSVRHADNESTSTIFNCGVNGNFETRNKAFAAFKTETLHRVELYPNELSEIVRPI